MKKVFLVLFIVSMFVSCGHKTSQGEFFSNSIEERFDENLSGNDNQEMGVEEETLENDNLGNPPCESALTVTDIDGNVYNTVQIGSQCWMRENLRTTRTEDGILIPQIPEVGPTPFEAYREGPVDNAWLVDDSSYRYNHAAAMKVCPKGWHLPARDEFVELFSYCRNNYVNEGLAYIPAKPLAATKGWKVSSGKGEIGNNQITNNASGFSALPVSETFGHAAVFWCDDYDKTELFNTGAYEHLALRLSYSSSGISFTSFPNGAFYSVRCIRD